MIREMRREVAPGPFKRVLDQVEHPVQESEREAPDDVSVRLADDHAGEAHVRHALDDVLDLTLAIVPVSYTHLTLPTKA